MDFACGAARLGVNTQGGAERIKQTAGLFPVKPSVMLSAEKRTEEQTPVRRLLLQVKPQERWESHIPLSVASLSISLLLRNLQ